MHNNSNFSIGYHGYSKPYLTIQEGDKFYDAICPYCKSSGLIWFNWYMSKVSSVDLRAKCNKCGKVFLSEEIERGKCYWTI